MVPLQVAFQQADYVAWNLWSSINARPLLPFKYQHLGDMMSLGAAPPRFHSYSTVPVISFAAYAAGIITLHFCFHSCEQHLLRMLTHVLLHNSLSCT